MAVAILKRTMPSTTKQSTTKQRRLRMWRHVQNSYYCGAYQKDLTCTIQSCDHLESQIPLSRAKSFDRSYITDPRILNRRNYLADTNLWFFQAKLCNVDFCLSCALNSVL